MTQENGIRILAGSMVLISLALGFFVSQWWYLLTAFVGLNLIQSGFTGFCPPQKLLAKLGFKEGSCSKK
jgi:disulfide bond formation protein DsbB